MVSLIYGITNICYHCYMVINIIKLSELYSNYSYNYCNQRNDIHQCTLAMLFIENILVTEIGNLPDN